MPPGIAYEACIELGAFAPTSSITIATNACNNEGSCYELGQFKASLITIGIGSCNTFEACQYIGENTSGFVNIGNSACGGVIKNSCEFAGRFLQGSINILIPSDSCYYTREDFRDANGRVDNEAIQNFISPCDECLASATTVPGNGIVLPGDCR